MKNELNIYSDDINVFVTLNVKAKLIGKIIMSVIMFILLAGYFTLLISIDSETMGRIIFPILIAPLIIIFLPARYLFWNLFGQERIIINTKSISYNYSYGIVQTNLKTIKFDKLGTGFDTSKMFDSTEHGTLVFVNYNQDTNLPETIFQTTIIISKLQLIEIDSEIRKVFYNEYLHQNNFIAFSLN
jgi:hypothetical protein